MIKCCVVILNYRRADLTIDCLKSLTTEMHRHDDRCTIIIDNASGDGSADVIEAAIRDNQWGDWARLIRSEVNGGFAAGNNIAFKDAFICLVVIFHGVSIDTDSFGERKKSGIFFVF